MSENTETEQTSTRLDASFQGLVLIILGFIPVAAFLLGSFRFEVGVLLILAIINSILVLLLFEIKQ